MAALAHILDSPRLVSPLRTTAADRDLWTRVDELVGRIGKLDDLRAHRLHLVAADRWRRLGLPVPPQLREEERVAAVLTLVAPVVLQRARDAYDGTIVLMKGLEVAARYRDVALRPFRDLDLLVDDALAAQRALLSAGFVEAGEPELYVDIHHLRPLVLPGLPLFVEIHERPKWPAHQTPPPTAELLEAASPGAYAVDGVLALPPEHHALLLAAHSWAHEPLRRLVEIVDIAALSAEAGTASVASLARAWGLDRVWSATSRARDAVLYEGRAPWTLRTWARNLGTGRERTVFESHLEHLLAPFSAEPWRPAFRHAARALAADVRPLPDETWRAKGSRTLQAVKNAFTARSAHDRALAERSEAGEERR
jgi:Uncharacterised nucleotidyltransferase